MKRVFIIGTLFLAVLTLGLASADVPEATAAEDLPVYLRDRGTGVPSSMFGTYIRKGEVLVYPYFEYYTNSDEEYAPDELGFPGADDFRGDYEAYEGLIFIGFGITEDLIVEFEVAVIDATLKTDPNDTSGVPAEISESGLGDVEGQIRLRLMREDERRPEVFGFFEVVLPTGEENSIIGTPDWEVVLGAGLTKGFEWGTLTGRASVEYDAQESKTEFGEYALEYLKRLSPSVKLYAAVEGSEDEVEFIPEVLWTFYQGYPSMTLVLNSAVGLTSKAQDWAPEVGIQFLF